MDSSRPPARKALDAAFASQSRPTRVREVGGCRRPLQGVVSGDRSAAPVEPAKPAERVEHEPRRARCAFDRRYSPQVGGNPARRRLVQRASRCDPNALDGRWLVPITPARQARTTPYATLPRPLRLPPADRRTLRSVRWSSARARGAPDNAAVTRFTRNAGEPQPQPSAGRPGRGLRPWGGHPRGGEGRRPKAPHNGVVQEAVSSGGPASCATDDPLVALIRAARPNARTALVIGLGMDASPPRSRPRASMWRSPRFPPIIVDFARRFFGYKGHAVVAGGRTPRTPARSTTWWLPMRPSRGCLRRSCSATDDPELGVRRDSTTLLATRFRGHPSAFQDVVQP